MHQQSAPHPTVPPSPDCPSLLRRVPSSGTIVRRLGSHLSIPLPLTHAGTWLGTRASIAVRCPSSSSNSHVMQQRLGVSAAFPVGPLLCTRGRVAVRPPRAAGCRELNGVGTRVPESSARAGAGLLDAGCAAGPSARGEQSAAPDTGIVPAGSVCSRGSRCCPSRAARAGRRHVTKPPTAEADTWTRVPRSVPRVPQRTPGGRS